MEYSAVLIWMDCDERAGGRFSICANWLGGTKIELDIEVILLIN